MLTHNREKFEDLPDHIKQGLADLNFDVAVLKQCLENPDMFTDVDFTARDRVDAMLTTLADLLI